MTIPAVTEEEYLALGETSARIELFDGSLLVTAVAAPRHQLMSRRVAGALEPGAGAAGLHVLAAVNVRLRAGGVAIPDVVVTAAITFSDPVVEAADVRLVAEVVSTTTSSAPLRSPANSCG